MKWLAAVLALGLVACADSEGSGPEILQLAPSVASPGDTVEILGQRFCAEQGVDGTGECIVPPAASVHIGAGTTVVRADTVRWADERIRVALPPDTATGVTLLTVSVEGEVSNAVDFEVVP